MEVKDFEGIQRFKLFLPAVVGLGALGMVLGPRLCPEAYEWFSLAVILYALAKFLTSCRSMVSCARSHRALLRHLRTPEARPALCRTLLHAFVVPSYREPEELLAETLRHLAAHPHASERYLVLLAMEGHETGAAEKAARLRSRFAGSFRWLAFTVHELRPGEQRGKASNVSWCVEHLEAALAEQALDPDNVFLTIQDADSWAPAVYVRLVEEEIARHFPRRHATIFVPPQIFNRNRAEVPAPVRILDDMHSYAHFGSLMTMSELTFGLSNYTISLRFAKSIGFWDTCADAIGEDMHIVQKSFFKTKGAMWTVPIHSPFSQLSLATGEGYWQDLCAKFWQAERHAQGACSAAAYTLMRFFENPLSPRQWTLTYSVLECSLIQLTLSFVVLSTWLAALGPQSPPSPVGQLNQALLRLLGLANVLCFFLYEYLKQSSAAHICGTPARHSYLRGSAELALLYMPCLALLIVPSFLCAAFRSLRSQREYTVAQKVSQTIYEFSNPEQLT